MKENKFRAWNGEAMEYGGFSVHATSGTIIPDTPLTRVTVISPLMQYTGLKDKNGVEIYEGDVVEHRSDLSSASEVKYFEGAFIAGSPVTSNALINFNCANNVSVIGNIYENKELLK